MKDFLRFRRMLTPRIIELVFWLGILACVGVGIYNMLDQQIQLGILVLILGPIILRLVLEFMILFFRMNETMTDIKQLLEAQAARQEEEA